MSVIVVGSRRHRLLWNHANENRTRPFNFRADRRRENRFKQRKTRRSSSLSRAGVRSREARSIRSETIGERIRGEDRELDCPMLRTKDRKATEQAVGKRLTAIGTTAVRLASAPGRFKARSGGRIGAASNRLDRGRGIHVNLV